MPRGAPDYSNVRVDNPVHRLTDLAELAARLGSASVFERAGDVIRIETFENGMQMWGSATYGAGAAVEISSYRALNSAFSLKMTCGSDDVMGAKATYQVPYLHLSKFGLEYAFTFDPSLKYHYFDLLIRDGTTRYTYSILFFIQDGKIGVKHSDNTRYTFVTDLNLETDAFLFHHGKLVVDAENKEYVRFLYDNQSFDLSEYAPYETEDTDPPYLEVSVEVRANNDTKPVSYIDTVLITRNEP